MEPLIRAGSMVAIDRDDREIKKNRAYAVRTEWGCTIKFLRREGDILT
jgi:phage repressor protein C with HTH and peptisase S24 domain